MSSIVLRELSDRERTVAFTHAYGKVELAQYVEAVRKMEGGRAYALPVNGTTPRALRVNMGRAAKALGLKLRWAKTPKDAAEIVVELAE